MENTEWVWLKHEGHEGISRFPAGVADDMAQNGWYQTDERPVEVDPTKAEMPREWFEEPKPAKKSTSKRASASTEGTDSDG